MRGFNRRIKALEDSNEIGVTRTVQEFVINANPEVGQEIVVDLGIGVTDFVQTIGIYARVIKDEVGENEATGVAVVISNNPVSPVFGGVGSVGFGLGINSFMSTEGEVALALWVLPKSSGITAFGEAVGEIVAFQDIYLNDQDNNNPLDETASVTIEVTTIVQKLIGPGTTF